MRLIKFTTIGEEGLLVNPDNVMHVHSADTGTMIALGDRGSYYVQGTLDEVAAKLMGESLVEEPENWEPKEGEQVCVVTALGDVNTTYSNKRWLEAHQEGRVFPCTKEGHKAAFEKSHELRWGSE